MKLHRILLAVCVLPLLCPLRGAPGDTTVSPSRTTPLLRSPASAVAANPTIRLSPSALRTATIARTNVQPASSAADAKHLKVFVQDAASWKRLDAPVTLTNRDRIVIPTVENKPALTLATKTNRETLSTRRVVLPFVMKSTNAAQDWANLQVELYAEPSPARWVSSENSYFTKVFVAVVTPGQRISAPLPAPISITLRGAGDAIPNPRELKLENTQQFVGAEVRFGQAESEPRIDAFPFTEEAPLLLPVRKFEALQVTAHPKTILGYGLGTTELTITRLGGDGQPLNEGPELDVKVSSNAGKTENSAVIPAGKSSVTVKFRSSARGTDRITAAVGTREAGMDIIYQEPWLFIGFALAGSLVGASARFLRHANRKKGHLARMIAEGCVAGLITTAAVCAGAALNVLPASVQQTEIFAFIISAAVAMIGVKAIDWLTKLAPTPVTPGTPEPGTRREEPPVASTP